MAQEIMAKYSANPSLSYEMDYGIKFFSDPVDTSRASAKIDLIRDTSDAVFGGHIWLEQDSIVRYYDTDSLYFILKNQRTVTRYPSDESWVIKGNIIGEATSIYFLRPSRLVKGSMDSTNHATLIMDSLNGSPVWHWRYDFEDDESSSNSYKDIWIDPQDLTLRAMEFHSEMQGESQHNYWRPHNMRYTDLQPAELRNRFEELTKGYTLKVIDPQEEEKKPMSLPVGSQVNNITGRSMRDTLVNLNLKQLSDELTLIDFWYMDCFPCIKSIPHLNELHHKYGDKGLAVIGLNPFNDNAKDHGRVANFFEHNTMDYPLLLIDRELANDLAVRVYPTAYLLDENGVILHVEIGFNEEAGSPKLDSIIAARLK